VVRDDQEIERAAELGADAGAEVTSSPRANRYEYSGPSVVRKPASKEKLVWTCVSPQNTRFGKCWLT
jgi:hypothetical protein